MKNKFSIHKNIIVSSLVIFVQIYIMAPVLVQSISSFFQILFILLLFILTLYYLKEIMLKKESLKNIYKIFFLYYLYIFFSIIISKNLMLSIYGFYEYIVFTSSFFAISYVIKKRIVDQRSTNFLIHTFALISLILVSLALIEYFSGNLLSSGVPHYFNPTQSKFIRAQVYSGSPLIFGMLMCCYSLCYTYMFHYSNNKIWILMATITILGMLLSGSRGPLMAFLIAYIAQLFLHYSLYSKLKSKSKKFKATLALTFGLFLVLFVVLSISYTGNNQVLKKIFSTINWRTDVGNVLRLERWSQSLEHFKTNIWLGTGISTTGSVTILNPNNIGVTESNVLKVLVELGIVGGILFYGIIAYILIDAFKYITSENNDKKPLIILCFSIIIAILVEGFVLQINEIFTVSIILWGCLGCIYTLSSVYVKENS